MKALHKHTQELAEDKSDTGQASLVFEIHNNLNPARPGSASRRGNDFKALQQHIQELTEDKFTLQRGLEHQARLAGTLADENEALVQRYNEQVRCAAAWASSGLGLLPVV